MLDRIVNASVDVPPSPAEGAGPSLPRRSERSLERWTVPTAEHASVADFLGERRLPNGIHTIHGGESPIDILVGRAPEHP